MASPDGRRSPSPSSRDGFLFKNGSGGAEEIERLARRPASPRKSSSRPRTAGTGTLPELQQQVAAFDDCLDYSKINHQRHTAGKVDTFNTPGSLNDKSFNTLVKVSKRDLYEICEQSFRRCVSTMTKDILRDVKLEMHESLELIRKDANGAAEAKEARDTTMTVLMTQIHESVLDRKTDINAIQKELRGSEVSLLEGSRDMILRLETKILQDLGQVRNEVQDMCRAQERAEESILVQIRDLDRKTREASEAAPRTAQELTSVAEMQKILNGSCLQNSREIAKMQEGQNKQTMDICNALKETASTNSAGDQFREELALENKKMSNKLEMFGQSVATDFSRIFSEIVQIQKALNVDFAMIKSDLGVLSDEKVKRQTLTTADTMSEELGHTMGRSSSGSKRLRDYFTQTSLQTVDAGAQTDEVKKKKARNLEPRSSVAIARTKTTDSAVEQKQTEKQKRLADSEAIKLKVRQALIKKQYNVMEYYHYDGWPQAIAKSQYFENLTFAVITLNAVWIAIDIDLNDSQFLFEAHPVFQVAENGFCAYFFSELLIRFLAFRRKKYCVRDFWFMFDSLLVTLMVAETWCLSLVFFFLQAQGGAGLGKASILRILRLAKMIRISRMVRLLRAFPEIVILLKGIAAATRSVSVFLLLWLLIIYVFAVVFRQITEGEPIGLQYFRSVPAAMNTLLLDGIFYTSDTATFVNDLGRASPFLFILILSFILLAGVTLTYMLIGVLVDVVAVIASAEKEGMTVISLSSQLRAAWEDLGKESRDPITKTDFKNMLIEPEICKISQSVGVDVIMLMDMTDVVFEDYEKEEKDMTFENFVELMLKMRGGNSATVRDIREHLKVTRATVRHYCEEMNSTISREMDLVRLDLAKQAEAQQQYLASMESHCLDGSDGEHSQTMSGKHSRRSSKALDF